MPKYKTRKSVAKRMKVTKNNKILRHQMSTRHLLSAKSAGRRRSLRRSVVLVGKFAQNALKMLRG